MQYPLPVQSYYFNMYLTDQPTCRNTPVAEFFDDKVMYTTNADPIIIHNHWKFSE